MKPVGASVATYGICTCVTVACTTEIIGTITIVMGCTTTRGSRDRLGGRGHTSLVIVNYILGSHVAPRSEVSYLISSSTTTTTIYTVNHDYDL